jgi:hypothetical protein
VHSGELGRGQFFTGRQAFFDRHDFVFRGQFHGSTLKQDIVSLKFVRPDVAVVEVLTSLTGFQKLSPEQMRMISDPSAHACYRS